jgi:DNA-binding response OmpR family regulator
MACGAIEVCLQRRGFDVTVADGGDAGRAWPESRCSFANANSPSPDLLRMMLELGATCCLRKPFTSGALLTAVNECLTKSTMTARPSK